jgi:hypothetical protein
MEATSIVLRRKRKNSRTIVCEEEDAQRVSSDQKRNRMWMAEIVQTEYVNAS